MEFEKKLEEGLGTLPRKRRGVVKVELLNPMLRKSPTPRKTKCDESDK
jgi:hypothetical protein